MIDWISACSVAAAAYAELMVRSEFSGLLTGVPVDVYLLFNLPSIIEPMSFAVSSLNKNESVGFDRASR